MNATVNITNFHHTSKKNPLERVVGNLRVCGVFGTGQSSVAPRVAIRDSKPALAGTLIGPIRCVSYCQKVYGLKAVQEGELAMT
jgi:hypothetical protein